MFLFPKKYDVIVVGGGHAGVEAALAAARIGCQTLLLTTNPDTIGQMSCNPAIGGLAKGHLAREVDALGGEMGKTTDLTGIQFRMLNTKKGPAVWAPRAQCDKKAYQFRLKWICEQQKNLDVRLGQASRLIHDDFVIMGVETELGVRYDGVTVVITTGTFLQGLMHVGKSQSAGGRAGETPALGLSASLADIGLQLGRLKTGTPPRLLRRSIDFTRTEIQLGDEPPPRFTYWYEDLFHVEQSHLPDSQTSDVSIRVKYLPKSILAINGGQVPCHLTRTTETTAKIIRDNLHLSPMYAGVIEGVGPRYCPSIEDKIVRFADKLTHQIFLEPEGLSTDEIYVNGFSTCLPFEVQYKLVRTIIGCENAEIIRPAYAVEYDYVDPTQIKSNLETKVCQNLFLAGQINGTSGYEEAAAQGIVAGINAANVVRRRPPLVLRRDQAYIGVLVDDLITKGTIEPYRMFTSRAEHRLTLRQDNADLRLAEIGFEVGLLPKRHHEKVLAKQSAITNELDRLNRTRVGSATLADLLRRPEVTYELLPNQNEGLSSEIATQVEIAVKYDGYVQRQRIEIERSLSLEDKKIPTMLDYNSVDSLSLEARQKLAEIRPETLGQASRISGVSPADISSLIVIIKKYESMLTSAAPITEVDDEQSTCTA